MAVKLSVCPAKQWSRLQYLSQKNHGLPSHLSQGSTDYQASEHRLFLVLLELGITTEGSVPYYVCGYRMEGNGPLACFAFEEIQLLKSSISLETIESYQFCNDLIKAKVATLSNDTNQMEKDHEAAQWSQYVLERLSKGKVYFDTHFIQNPLNGVPTATANCFGHLMPMWEAMALANPDYLSRKMAAIGTNEAKIRLVRDLLAILVE